MTPEPLEGRTVMFASHHATSGPADALEEYAGPRAAHLVAVYHAFPYADVVESRLRRWRGGSLVATKTVPWSPRVPGPLTWVKEVAQTVWWGVRQRRRFDVFVGIDPLNALAGLVLRALGRTDRVAFWTIDYVPSRFGSVLLNRVYHALDRLCVARCDETWNVSPRIEEGRREAGVVGRQRVVPMGAHARDPSPPGDPHRIVYLGSLLEKQGVQGALRALPLVRERVPDAHVLVIGDGPFRRALERLAAELGVERAVEFTGYLDDHRRAEDLIASSGVALATYDPATADFTYFADPGKVKNYLAAGVPVVATDIAWSARWLADAGAGVVVEFAPDAIASGILRLLDDEEARAAAARLGAGSDWSAVLDEAFCQILERPA